MTEDTAALARLTVQVEHLTSAVRDLTSDMAAIRTQLDEARGGAAVLRWMGFGSLAAFLGLAITVYGWLRGVTH